MYVLLESHCAYASATEGPTTGGWCSDGEELDESYTKEGRVSKFKSQWIQRLTVKIKPIGVLNFKLD